MRAYACVVKFALFAAQAAADALPHEVMAYFNDAIFGDWSSAGRSGRLYKHLYPGKPCQVRGRSGTAWPALRCAGMSSACTHAHSLSAPSS